MTLNGSYVGNLTKEAVIEVCVFKPNARYGNDECVNRKLICQVQKGQSHHTKRFKGCCTTSITYSIPLISMWWFRWKSLCLKGLVIDTGTGCVFLEIQAVQLDMCRYDLYSEQAHNKME
jgi:hypothetical protein